MFFEQSLNISDFSNIHTGTITDGTMRVCDCVEVSNHTDYTIREIIGSMMYSFKETNPTSEALIKYFDSSSLIEFFTLLYSIYLELLVFNRIISSDILFISFINSLFDKRVGKDFWIDLRRSERLSFENC